MCDRLSVLLYINNKVEQFFIHAVENTKFWSNKLLGQKIYIFHVNDERNNKNIEYQTMLYLSHSQFDCNMMQNCNTSEPVSISKREQRVIPFDAS